MQQQVPASFLGFKSVIIKNLSTFVNLINYKELGVKRVWNWHFMWTMQLHTCLEKHVSFKHVCYKHASVLVWTQLKARDYDLKNH